MVITGALLAIESFSTEIKSPFHRYSVSYADPCIQGLVTWPVKALCDAKVVHTKAVECAKGNAVPLMANLTSVDRISGH